LAQKRCAAFAASLTLLLASAGALKAAEVTARLAPTALDAMHGKGEKTPPAVMWLKPNAAEIAPTASPGKFTLLQKNKMFSPHLLVVPVGSTVSFPNADPFFHNVFSLFDGRRFDLGLYEAGSTRGVAFSREGVSYIFCNVHPDMSAVVIALTTPFFSIADAQGAFHLRGVPDGEYELHVWVEGHRDDALNHLTRRVRISGEAVNLGEISPGPQDQQPHLNKFGRPYEPESKPIY
jgi:plastocyanin